METRFAFEFVSLDILTAPRENFGKRTFFKFQKVPSDTVFLPVKGHLKKFSRNVIKIARDTKSKRNRASFTCGDKLECLTRFY